MKKLIFAFMIFGGTFAHASAADIRYFLNSCTEKVKYKATIISCNRDALHRIDREIPDVVKQLQLKNTAKDVRASLETSLAAEIAAFETLRDAASNVDALLGGSENAEVSASNRKVSISLYELNSLEKRLNGNP
ncbi:MAG: hypothetical protein ACXVCP_15575 [Bdellovibrio sp.]